MRLSVMKRDAAWRKRKMISSRIIGVVSCLLSFGAITVYYLGKINQWMCIIVLAYCLGNIFSANSFLQDIRVGNPWQRINGICSVFFYALAIFLIVWGFITKELVLQF